MFCIAYCKIFLFFSFDEIPLCYLTEFSVILAFLNKFCLLLLCQYSVKLKFTVYYLVFKHLYFVVCFFCDFLVRLRMQENFFVIKISKFFILFSMY